jgi:hypothetical protein
LFFNSKGRNLVSRTPLDRMQVIRFPNYPDRLGPLVKFGENSTILTYFEITGYRIKYSTVLWHLELHIRRGRKVRTQVQYILQTVTAELQTANIAYFKRKSQLSKYSTNPDVFPSQLFRISAVLLYPKLVSFLWGIMKKTSADCTDVATNCRRG